MIGHTPQVALFDQLYEFYVDGTECLRFSPTIKPYFCDDIIDKNGPFMQEINSTLNELHFKNKLLTIQDVLLRSNLTSGKDVGMLNEPNRTISQRKNDKISTIDCTINNSLTNALYWNESTKNCRKDYE